MLIRFFRDPNNKDEVIPQKSKEDACAHFTWCLKQLISDLDNSNDEKQRSTILTEFSNNMHKNPMTKKMLEEFSGLFAQLVNSKPLPSNEYIINYLKGMPTYKERIYVSYTIENMRNG